MRKLIAGMRVSLDSQFEGPDGYADWVDAWSDGYGVVPQCDACLLGAGMYPGYEQYWTRIQNEPDQPHPATGQKPTPDEVEYARFTARTPHYVLSTTMNLVSWPQTSFLRGVADVETLKKQSGKDIYLVGGGQTLTSLIDAGLVDELRLTIYPLIAGGEKALFATIRQRHNLELRKVDLLESGKVSLIYEFK